MKSILINIFVLSCLFSFAQSDSISISKKESNKMTFGANILYFVNFDLSFKDGFLFATSAVIKNDKQSISIAPLWWIDKNKSTNFYKGGMLSYQFYPNGNRKSINFYFIYDLLYTFEKNEWERNMEYFPNQFYNVSFKSISNSMKNQVGYGFNINICRGFYINQSMSFGVEFYNYISKTIVKDNPSLSSEYSSGNLFSHTNASSFLKIGIGYNFKK
jgi:hypothetical protein